MKTFVKLRSLLDSIPASLLEEDSEASFMDRFQDGLKLLPSTIQYEPKIDLFEIIDGRVQLPKYVKQINNVYWQSKDPSDECVSELETACAESLDQNDNICRPTITYKMWLDSPYFNQTFEVLRYAGTDKSLIANNCECFTSRCSESFVVTPQKTMYLTIDEGFICVNYDSPICDEKGEILIPDNQLLNEFLVAYAISKHWENRMFTKETQAFNFYKEYNQKQALLLRQAKGNLLMREVNVHDLMNINGQYTKLVKLPEIMFYGR